MKDVMIPKTQATKASTKKTTQRLKTVVNTPFIVSNEDFEIDEFEDNKEHEPIIVDKNLKSKSAVTFEKKIADTYFQFL
jgi:hypothetical protein